MINKVNRVEQHIISKNHTLYKNIDRYCFLSKNLYNYSNYMIRQVFIITSKLSKEEEISQEQKVFLENINKKVDEFNKLKKLNYEKSRLKHLKENKEFKKKLIQLDYFTKDKKYLGYDFLEFLVKEDIDYKSMMSQCSQQNLRLLDKNWISFFESIKDYKNNKSKYKGVPKLPNYKKKDGRYITIFTNQNCKHKDNFIIFPKCFDTYKLKTKIKGKLQQVRITPRGSNYLLEVVYSLIVNYENIESKNICGIDMGVNNLATLTNNIGKSPIVINGKVLKSINQYYNKSKAKIISDLMKRHNKNWSNKLGKLNTKRNNKIKDYMHKCSKKIIDYCLEHELDTIVIGNNKEWKQEVCMSKKNNQNFVQIPFDMLIKMIKYKGYDANIKVILSEESYTSGTSFLDGEEPIKGFYNKSRRIKRGLFKSNEGILINSDVNGSYQIIKKVVPKAFANGIEGVGLHPVRVNIV
ncbi:transposase [Romboutsia sedimentorum]|uniref:Transposase n=1 Tax=Romboutsia sedimentorum TaxID=1368474 RepID=A0ABT7E5M7_9FIRM|nr:transposase [Romboutsia sedimentorum]MDK2562211.1 transposase [Romboutsia sedimentorum]